MQLLPLVGGAIVPHAPLLLPELESDEVADAARLVRGACRQIRFHGADVVVILSPHAAVSGVYRSSAGSLDAFGIAGIEEEGIEDAEATKEFADLASLGMLHDEADHGVVVTSRLLGCDVPVVAAGFAEAGSPNATHATADRLSGALVSLASGRRVSIVASANGSAGLSARAPLTELRGARAIEGRLRDAVETDLGRLTSLAREMRSLGGSCAQGPLEVLGELFSGRRARVFAHEAPVGVGYMVAAIDAS